MNNLKTNDVDYFVIANLFKTQNKEKINDLLNDLVPFIKQEYENLSVDHKTQLTLVPLMLIDHFNLDNINMDYIKNSNILNDYLDYLNQNYEKIKENSFISDSNSFKFAFTITFLKIWMKKENQ